MEQRDYIIIGLVLLVIMQQYKILKLNKESYCTRIGLAAALRWMEEIHKIRIPSPNEGNKDFERILMECRDNDLFQNNLF